MASVTRSPSAPRLITPWRGLASVYAQEARNAIAEQFQYRVANYFYMIGMVAEPVIYLVVWSTIAEQQGGEVGGFTPGEFAGYYIVWTLVRNMNIVSDLGYFAGWKLVVIVLWLPLAAVLSLLFHPQINPTPLGILVFAIAIWGAYLIRSLNQSSVGMITFWTTRVGPIFELYLTLELLLSGRLVPLSLMPDWAQQLANFLPFKWTFGFPIEALLGTLTNEQLIGGLFMQLFWIVVGSLFLRFMWHFAIKRYSAVGG
jgi:ABC-2 type transport system permease protein